MTIEEARTFLDNLKVCIKEHPIVADWLVEIADRKTENSSEKPNNCEECKHWNDTEDGCADRHGCRTTTEDCSTVPTSSKMEQVDEPQTCSVNGRPYDCGNCEYFKCTADEPQTEREGE